MIFHFKHFSVQHQNAAMKVGTDAMVLGAMANLSQAQSILDIGAGTGVLSLMMAQKNPEAIITAMEIDESAFKDAQINFSNSHWKDRLKVLQADFLTHQFHEKFDFIISNPPFYQKSLHNPDKQLATARHNDYLPMDALLKKVADLLTDSGSFWLIFPFADRSNVIALAEASGLFARKEITVNGKPESPVRTVIELSLENIGKVEQRIFDIRTADGSYSDEYRELTIDFHGKAI